MIEEHDCPTKLVEDTPAIEDAFGLDTPCGPHDRVARAITDLIQSVEPGGKVIGLEGSWGSGKSTIVKFVSDRLEKQDSHVVITFDAWAHEGDPLRRVFLETLINNLIEKKWVDVDKWRKVLDEIANRRKVQTTRTIPNPTLLGTLLAISLFAVPFGTAFLLSALRDDIGLSPEQPVSWKFVLGLFSIGPIIVLLGNALVLSFNRPWSWSRPITLHRIRRLSSWAFLEGKMETETKTETVESANPTSLEFEKYFGELMDDAVGGDEKRKFVLVLDNLDRVDPKDALEIWSTLQTFVRERISHVSSWYSRLWVLVPYDPNGLRKLWSNRTRDNTDGIDGDDDYVGPQSFIDKSFQIRFQVPPPVLSNWRDYLYKLAEEALPEHDKEDFHSIYRVFELCREQSEYTPTPRELKIYINQIGAIHRQWQHEFPIEHVAYFVLRCRDARMFVQRLRQGDVPDIEALRWLVDGLKDSLAGLVFNVPAISGRELLLAEPIYDALCSKNTEVLNSLEEGHGTGFYAVLENVATSKFSNTEPDALANTGYCLVESGLLSNAASLKEMNTVRRDLVTAAREIEVWPPLNRDMAEGIAALCTIASDQSFSVEIVNKLASALGSDGQERPVEPVELAEAMHTVFKTIEQIGHEESLSSVTLPVDVDGWATICEYVATEWHRKFWKFIRPGPEFADIVARIIEVINNDQVEETHLKLIEVSGASRKQSDWDDVVASLRQRMDASHNVGYEPAVWLLRTLWLLRKLGNRNAGVAIKELSRDGHLMHHLHGASGVPDRAVWFVFVFLEQCPEAAKPPAVGNSEQGFRILQRFLASEDETFAKLFLELVDDEDCLSLLVTITDERQQYDSLIRLCLRQIAKGEEPSRLFTSDLILEKWVSLKDAMNTEHEPHIFSDLVAQLSKSTDLCTKLIGDNRGFVAENIELYAPIVEAGECSSSNFGNWCKNGLEGVDESIWRKDLGEECVALQFLLGLRDRGHVAALGHRFSDALEDHGKALAKGSEVPSEELGMRWADVLELLNDSTRAMLRERLLKIAIEMDGDISSAFFEVYGMELADPEIVAGDRRSVSNLFSPIVKRKHNAGLAWLIEFLSSNSKFLDDYENPHAVKDFKARVSETASSDLDDESRALIKKLAAALGISKDSMQSKLASNGDETQGNE